MSVAIGAQHRIAWAVVSTVNQAIVAQGSVHQQRLN